MSAPMKLLVASVDEYAELSQYSKGSNMTHQNIATNKTNTGFEPLLTPKRIPFLVTDILHGFPLFECRFDR
jgi:hypothetical protein